MSSEPLARSASDVPASDSPASATAMPSAAPSAPEPAGSPGTAGRVVAAARFRLAAAVRDRSFVAPVVAFAVVEGLFFASPGGYPQDNVTMALAAGVPIAAWAGRVVLDVEPDDQRRLTQLATGSRLRAHLAELLAAAVVVLPMLVLGVLWGIARHAEPTQTRVAPPPQPALAAVVVAGLLLAVGFGLAAVAIAALASRQVAGGGFGPVAVLVGIPVLAGLVGQSRSGLVTLLMPQVFPAVIDAQERHLPSSSPWLALHAVAWTAVVLSAQWWARRRR